MENGKREIVNIGHGNPTLFRKFWDRSALLPEIRTQDNFLYEYQEEEPVSLSETIHRFHHRFNVDSPSSSLVYGNGSTQVIHAVLYTLAIGRKKLVVGITVPMYMMMLEFLRKSPWIEITENMDREDIDLEIVIDPNNPSGETRRALSKAKYVIFDRAYHWDMYTETSPISTDPNHITVYTASKLFGFGGVRLGWAFVNDFELSQRIKNSLQLIGICPNSFGMSVVELQMERFLFDPYSFVSLVRSISEILYARRKRLLLSRDFDVKNISGAYVWICGPGDIAKTLLEKYGVKVYGGEQFGVSENYARISLICSGEEFSLALERMAL